MPIQLSRGLTAGLLSYTLWGLFPLYWRVLANIPPSLILAHRIVWSFIAVLLFVRWSTGFAPVRSILRNKALILPLFASGVLIGANWLIYITAVNHGAVVEASLGYFVTPIITLAVGVLVLKERLTKLQKISLGLVVLGVSIRAVGYGAIPWYALGLAVTFSLYSLIRKLHPVDPSHGLLVETSYLFIPAGAFIIFAGSSGAITAHTPSTLELGFLLGAGVITALPLGLFAIAAQELPFKALSIIQYISPTIQLLLGYALFNEKVSLSAWLAFGCVWLAVACFLTDAFRRRAQKRGQS